MRAFTSEREWERFHDPKSLVLTIAGQVGELSELFQWLPATDARDRAQEDPLKSRVAEEMADTDSVQRGGAGLKKQGRPPHDEETK
jgi:NTP pyrophosphatase (non-canonical NTP hydrolase)